MEDLDTWADGEETTYVAIPDAQGLLHWYDCDGNEINPCFIRHENDPLELVLEDWDVGYV